MSSSRSDELYAMQAEMYTYWAVDGLDGAFAADSNDAVAKYLCLRHPEPIPSELVVRRWQPAEIDIEAMGGPVADALVDCLNQAPVEARHARRRNVYNKKPTPQMVRVVSEFLADFAYVYASSHEIPVHTVTCDTADWLRKKRGWYPDLPDDLQIEGADATMRGP